MFYERLTLLNLVEQHPSRRARTLLWRRGKKAGGGSRAGGGAGVTPECSFALHSQNETVGKGFST